MKTTRGDATILAVGGGNFLIPDKLKGAAKVVRPPLAAVANAVGAAISQLGVQVEHIVTYDSVSRASAIDRMRSEAVQRIVAAGGDASKVEIVEVDEVFLSYLPGRAAQLRVMAVGDLAGSEGEEVGAAPIDRLAHHAP